jgi:hypothetical protein
MMFLAALGGLVAGLLVAVAWTAGYRQGRHDVLIVTRAFADHQEPIRGRLAP